MKTNQELLKAFIQTNKVAREKKAIKLGFRSAEDYISFLKGTPTPKKQSSGKGKSTVINIVDILDVSGSMNGPKLKAAIEGINFSRNELKKEKEISYLYSYCEFSEASYIVANEFRTSIANVGVLRTASRGATALYDAIGTVVERLLEKIDKNEKVLVNIYTDGEENCSIRFSKEKIGKMIEELGSKNFTFTFIGTQSDVQTAQKNLKFHASNTLVHDNTGAGMQAAFTTNTVARSMYAEKVKKGEDVTTGFYKNIK